MSRKEQIALTLRAMKQKQYFLYVRLKLQEAIMAELESNHSTGFFSDREFEVSKNTYETKLRELYNFLNVDFENYPARSFLIINAVLEQVNPKHSLFEETILAETHQQHFKLFISSITNIMHSYFFSQFSFFKLSEIERDNIIEFFKRVIPDEAFTESILNLARVDNNEEQKCLSNYILLEVMMNFVREKAIQKINPIHSFYIDSVIYQEFKNSGKLLKSSTIDQGAAYIESPVTFQSVREECQKLINVKIEFYANKIIKKETLLENEIPVTQKLKKLRKYIEHVSYSNNDDPSKVVRLLKFVFSTPPVTQFSSHFFDNFLTNSYKEVLEKYIGDITLRDETVNKHLRIYLDQVTDIDFEKLVQELEQKCSMDVSNSVLSKSGVFSMQSSSDGEEDDSPGPPTHKRTNTEPPIP